MIKSKGHIKGHTALPMVETTNFNDECTRFEQDRPAQNLGRQRLNRAHSAWGPAFVWRRGNHHSEMLFHAVLLRYPSQPFESPISWLIAIYISDAYTHPLSHLTASNCPFLLRFHFPVTTHFFSLTPHRNAFPPGSLYASRDTCTCTGSLAGGTIITITGSDLMGKNQAGTFIC